MRMVIGLQEIKKILDEPIESFFVLAAYLGIRGREEKLIKFCVNFIELNK